MMGWKRKTTQKQQARRYGCNEESRIGKCCGLRAEGRAQGFRSKRRKEEKKEDGRIEMEESEREDIVELGLGAPVTISSEARRGLLSWGFCRRIVEIEYDIFLCILKRNKTIMKEDEKRKSKEKKRLNSLDGLAVIVVKSETKMQGHEVRREDFTLIWDVLPPRRRERRKHTCCILKLHVKTSLSQARCRLLCS
jgi:hypothetical protein